MRGIVGACGLVAAVTSGCGSDAPRPSIPFLHDPPAGPQTENAVVLPPYPQERDLLEFAAGPVGSHRYFVDRQSILVGADGIVRYSMVVRAAGGAVNTSYEGIRCTTGQKRIFAVGRSGDKWVEAKSSQWTEINARSPNEYQATLYTDYFCPNRLIIRDRDEAIRTLLRRRSRGPQ